MTENCSNCTFFDGSRHENDKRTSHAGICSKWSQIVFKTEICKQYFFKGNEPAENIFKSTQIDLQTTLFN